MKNSDQKGAPMGLLPIERKQGAIEGSPKVSVLVPCFNVAQYLPTCLDSLVGQTLEDIQIICLDDGSTDETPAIIDDYARRDKRITVVHKANSGYGATMNYGLSLASGAYVGIVESDDFIDVDGFERLYALARRHDLDLVKAEFYNHVDGQDSKESTFEHYQSCGARYGKVFDPANAPAIIRSTPSIWAALYRRRMITDHGIRFSETPGASFQDTAFVQKCWFAARRAMVIPDAFLHYRNDNPNSSVKSTTKIFAVADEFDAAAAFMGVDLARQARFLPDFNTIRFDTYQWNYNRIAQELRREFAGRMVSDWRLDLENGTLAPDHLDEWRWKLVEEALADADSFAENHKEGF